MTANLVRNLWAFMIIFCGHFPDGTQEFTEEETENETRGQWYLRQLLGSANITGGKLFHVMSGNLSHQIEHHLFPDIPAHRYAEIAAEVREICERYGLPYNSRSAGQAVRQRRAQDREAGAAGSHPGPGRQSGVPERRRARRAGPRGRGLTVRSWDDLNVPLSKAETRKDVVQVVVESGATHAGRIAGIVSGAVRDVTRELGEFTTELFEMRDASQRAERDRQVAEQPEPGQRVEPELIGPTHTLNRDSRLVGLRLAAIAHTRAEGSVIAAHKRWRRPARPAPGVECPGGCDPL